MPGVAGRLSRGGVGARPSCGGLGKPNPAAPPTGCRLLITSRQPASAFGFHVSGFRPPISAFSFPNLSFSVSIRCVDAAGGAHQGPGPPAGGVLERDEPFYGTRVGPGWYQGGTRVVPGWPGGATCHSQYCECLCKPAASHPHATLGPGNLSGLREESEGARADSRVGANSRCTRQAAAVL